MMIIGASSGTMLLKLIISAIMLIMIDKKSFKIKQVEDGLLFWEPFLFEPGAKT